MNVVEVDARLILTLREQPRRFDDLWRRQAAALGELVALSGMMHFESTWGQSVLKIRELSEQQAELYGAARHQSEFQRFSPERYICLECTVPINLDALASDCECKNVEQNLQNLRQFGAIIVSSDLEKLAGDIKLMAALSSPGSVEPLNCQISVDGQMFAPQELYPSVLCIAYERACDLGWPPISDLPMNDCLLWLRRLPGFRNGTLSGPAGRAVSAFCHVVGFEESKSLGAALMWCMIGLESLYTRGKEGLAEQLFEKAQVLLGPVGSNKKKFKNLYSFRSRFVHGDLDFPLAYTPYDADRMKNEDELDEAAFLSIAFLLATLQRMIQDGMTDLNYKWVLESGNNFPDKQMG